MENEVVKLKETIQVLYGEIFTLKARMEDIKPFAVYAREQEELEDAETQD